MALPKDFPGKVPLEKEGYETVEEVSEATDAELIAVDGIADKTLADIRKLAPYKPSADDEGTGKTSGAPTNSVEPTAQSFQDQTSGAHKDQTDPVTGQDLPKGIVKNARGTLTASSTVEQDDMVSPKQIEAERKAMLQNQGAKIAALLEG